ncbi:hemolysin III [Candidatus Magnetomorum sp. HK-1]|nr:hemolysin III [Candidatus Magnetomorum sp. HK-1]
MEKLPDDQSLGEEIANSIIHGIGAALSIAGLVLLIVFASTYGYALKVVSFSIFGTTLFVLYMSSTLYHSFTSPKVKYVFRIMDHVSIYLLIAGTYTPVVLVGIRGAWGWTLFGIIWGMAVLGIVFKICFMGRFSVVSSIFYLLMGWMVIIAIKPMISTLPTGFLVWLVIGGLSYTIGIIFFAIDKIPFNHVIWHFFVIGGSISHFFGMIFYLV